MLIGDACGSMPAAGRLDEDKLVSCYVGGGCGLAEICAPLFLERLPDLDFSRHCHARIPRTITPCAGIIEANPLCATSPWIKLYDSPQAGWAAFRNSLDECLYLHSAGSACQRLD